MAFMNEIYHFKKIFKDIEKATKKCVHFNCAIEFNFIVLFSYLIKYNHIMFIVIVFWLGSGRPLGLLFLCMLTSFHSHASLLTFFVRFDILCNSCCSHARVFGKTLVQEFHISFSHTEWYLFFSDSVTRSAHFCIHR